MIYQYMIDQFMICQYGLYASCNHLMAASARHTMAHPEMETCSHSKVRLKKVHEPFGK